MKKIIFAIIAAAVSIAAIAQEKTTKPAVEGVASQEIASLRLANDLIKYGYKQQQALPLINALQIMSTTQTQAFSGEIVEGESGSKESSLSFDVQKIIEDAKNFADGDEALLEMISKIEETENNAPHRGAVGGPCRRVQTLYANRYITYNCNFVANRTAEIAVSGDGDTDLDLYVYDSNGNVIASDVDYSDDCYVRWVPRWTGRFIIKIVNNGGVANRFVLLTN